MLWTLFVLWLIFALLDMIISGLAIRAGAGEVGLLFLICNDWQLTCFVKGVASFLFGMILVAYQQKALLAISCAVYCGLSLYNGLVLWAQISA